MLYDDGLVACDDAHLIIRRYYPWGGAKRIAYTSIRSVTKRPLSGVSGRWRIWGSGDFVHWWNLDTARPNKEVALVVDVGRRTLPTITPDDADAVYGLLVTRSPS